MFSNDMLQYMIETMQGAKAGQEVEHRNQNSSDAWEPSYEPTWDWYTYEFRIKPKPRE